MLSDTVNEIIENAINKFDNSYSLNGQSFENLVSMGEVVDRLSVVNFKLYNLKNEVMRRKNDEKFKAWASEEDVYLCRERSKLKRCIDEKLSCEIQRALSGKQSSFNPETKLYE